MTFSRNHRRGTACAASRTYRTEQSNLTSGALSTGIDDRPGRKQRLKSLADQLATVRAQWWERAAFFHAEDLRYMRFLVPPGSRVLELGCGIGDLLAALEPSYGVGVDFSERMVEQARGRHPGLESMLIGPQARR